MKNELPLRQPLLLHQPWMIAVAAITTIGVFDESIAGADWPMYRHDAARSGVTSEKLDTRLHLQWVHHPQHAPSPAWPEPGKEMHRMAFDYAYQVAIADGLVFFGSSSDHKLYALDLATGEERWHFFTEGPVRFAPAVSGGQLFVASDDGCVYCLSAGTGKLIWRFRTGPGNERLIGNDQMISRWPVRAGVLVEGDTIYVTAGMWSCDGVYVYALRAKDGAVIWKNDSCGNIYMGLPHNMCEGIAGLAPQGYLVFWKDVLAVPNGRAEPGGFDAKTGKLLFCQNETEKMHHPGGSRVFAANDFFFGERRPMLVDSHAQVKEAGPAPSEGLLAYDVRTGEERLAIVNRHRAVVSDNVMYCTGAGKITAVDMKVLLTTGKEFYAAGKADPNIPSVPPTYHPSCFDGMVDQNCGTTLQAGRSRLSLYPWAPSAAAPFSVEPLKKWQASLDWAYELILAGNTLIAGGRDKVTAVSTKGGEIRWQAKVNGEARGLAAADGRLIVSTSTGEIVCFGPKEPHHPKQVRAAPKKFDASPETNQEAERILKETNVRAGYCLMVGAGDGRLAGELARQSDLVIYCIEPDAERAAKARQMLDRAGFYGPRVVVHHGQLDPLPYADYFANLIVIDPTTVPDAQPWSAAEIYRVLRPYGGVAHIRAVENQVPGIVERLRGSVPASEIRKGDGAVQVVRGKLPGAGEWTHEYANASRPAASNDRRVRLPLGMLWFGGPGPARMVSRHWRAPAPLFANGRMFIAGEHHVIGVDAYNGRELWSRELPGVGRFPSRQLGGNIVADDTHVYAIVGADCLQLDAATGETVHAYPAPAKTLDLPVLENPIDKVRGGRSPGNPVPNKVEWEYLAVADQFIIGATGLSNFAWTWWPEAYPEAKYVFALRKGDGEVAWVHPAENSISPDAVAIQGKQLFLIDQVSHAENERRKKRGEKTRAASVLISLDLASGRELWRTKEELKGSMLWMGDDVLLVTGGGPHKSVYSAQNGKLLWAERASGSDHPVITRDTIYAYPRAYDLRTGEPKTHAHPLTGEPVPWTVGCKQGCGAVSGCPTMLFFRAAASGFCDLANDSGTHWLGQVRSSCWLSTIAAGGMVLMPEGSSSCTCPYNFQTSIAMVPTKRNENWSVFPEDQAEPGERIRQLALNLGAVGDQRSDAGTPWLAYPRPFRPGSLVLPMFASGPVEYGRRNADDLPIENARTTWVYTSGCAGPLRAELDMMLDRPAVALPCTETPKIDGRLDDACWDGKSPLRFGTDEQALDNRVVAFLRHDDKNLYVGFRREASMRDGKTVPWTVNQKQHDAPCWRDDSLNIRIGDGSRVMCLYVSASGATYDGIGTQSTGPQWNGPWDSAVQLTPELLTMEIAIPWTTVEKAKFKKKGLRIRLHSHNQTGVGPEMVQYKYRTWHRVGVYARLVTIAYAPVPKLQGRTYRVRLHFAELQDVKPGQRVFDVNIQGKTVIRNLDVVTEAGGPRSALVKEVAGIRVGDTLTLELVARSEQPPILSGFELCEEQTPAPAR